MEISHPSFQHLPSRFMCFHFFFRAVHLVLRYYLQELIRKVHSCKLKFFCLKFPYVHVVRKIDSKIGPPVRRHLKCARKISIYNIETIFTSFGQNTAEFFYDNHILLTMLCIFLREFGLKWRNLLLHPTENIVPPLDTRSPSHCSFIS